MKILTGSAKAKISRPAMPPKRPRETLPTPHPSHRRKPAKPTHDPLFEALREELGL